MLRASRALARLLRPVLPQLLEVQVVRALVLGLYFAKPSRISPDVALSTVRGFAEAPGVTAILPRSRQYRFPATVGCAPVAATIVWGERDRLLIGGQGRRARQLVPEARHVRLPGSGHVPMFDDPSRVAGLMAGP